jgi:hypothetical protein
MRRGVHIDALPGAKSPLLHKKGAFVVEMVFTEGSKIQAEE